MGLPERTVVLLPRIARQLSRDVTGGGDRHTGLDAAQCGGASRPHDSAMPDRRAFRRDYREILHAEQADLVRTRKIGNTRLVRASTASPHYAGLVDVLTKAFGVPAVLAAALRPVVHSTASRLPGLYQVGRREGGVHVRGGCSGAGDGNERDRVTGDAVTVALERYEVVVVELACLQPLD